MSYNFLRAAVKKILQHPNDFDWSVQGLGMMRLYLDKPSIRLHIWDSSLKIAGVSALHNHPWDFHSVVIAGVMRNRRYDKLLRSCTGYEEFNEVQIKCGENACTRGETTKVWLCESPEEKYHAGSDYYQKFSEIHLSSPEDGTVTLVSRVVPKDNSPDYALVFWRGNGPWVDAKPREAEYEEVKDVCARALTTWF